MKPAKAIAFILAAIGIVSLSQIFIFAANSGDRKEDAKQTTYSNPQIYSPKIPDTLSFAGESVPLDIYYVREGLDRELIVNTFGHTNTLLYFKRAHRFFPIIEPILKKNGVPSDFKYLCVIESGLTNATSPAKAQGFWQFIKTTGQKYGLEVTDEVDMRNNLEAATEAACKYLKSLHNQFGNWTDAAAAYNCGEAGLSKNMQKQSCQSYYDTRLNNETTRYVYRILAVKQIMQHPQDYGFFLRSSDLYPSITTRTSTLKGQNIDLYSFAKENGVSYKMLKELNPWLLSDKLVNKQNKSYQVKLPTEDGTRLSKIRTDRDKKNDFITKM